MIDASGQPDVPRCRFGFLSSPFAEKQSITSNIGSRGWDAAGERKVS